MTQEQKSPILFTARLLWGAMLGANLLFVVLAALAHPFNFIDFGGEFFARAEILVCLMMSAANLGAAFLLPHLFHKSNVKRLGLPQTENEVLRRGFPMLLMRLVFTEAVGLFGFVAAQTAENSAVILPFTAVALLIFLLSFPTYRLLRDWQS